MRTSLNEIRLIEEYLHNKTSVENTVLAEARILAIPAFRQKVRDQQKVYNLVKMYGRKKLKNDLVNIHRKLFSDPQHISFREKILRMFK